MDTEARLAKLEALFSQLLQSDRYTFHKTLQVLDGRNIQLGTTTGTKIGTATTQKIGFFNKTPVAQQSAVTRPIGGGSGITDAIDLPARAAINTMITEIGSLGLWVAN